MAFAVTALRIALGVLFLVSGVATIVGHAVVSRSFAHWGIPAPGIAVWVIAAVELVCGGLFAFGILTRPVGLLLATVMVGAALTSGRADGGLSLVVPIFTFGALVFVAWRSDRLTGAVPLRRPGVQ